MNKIPPPCRDAIKWLRARKVNLAPLTGQDSRALQTFAHALHLYCYSDELGQACALQALRASARAMQVQTQHIAKSLIPWALDWGDEDRLWAKLGFVAKDDRKTIPGVD